MNKPLHMISAPASRWTSERIIGFGFVGLLHIIAIYALVTGLAQKIVRIIPREIQATVLPIDENPQPKIDAPKMPDIPAPPLENAIQPPDFRIANDKTPPITLNVAPPPQPETLGDTSATGISSTHTTPPYPAMARKLEEQGTVKLRLTISPQGSILSTDIAQSSGFPDLDQTAVSWVLAHWKYKPAVQGGVAVQSTALAAVVFNLKNAR